MTIYNDVAIDTYLRALTAKEDDVLLRARERAATEDMPPVPPEVGSFLSLAVRWTRARNALEIGTGPGVSGVWIVRGLPEDGTLTTIDVDTIHQRLARRAYEEAGILQRIKMIHGRALDVLPTLPAASYEFIFIDPAKTEYPQYLDHALRLIKPGGVIIADNVLFSGRAANPLSREPETEGLRVYNQRISTHPRLHSVILPLGDGVTVSLVTS